MEGSFELLLKKESGELDSGFRLESFHVTANKKGNCHCTLFAAIEADKKVYKSAMNR